MKILQWALFFSLLIFTSCKKEADLSNLYGVELDYNYTVTIKPHDFQVHFNKILEDSRCPINAFCAWEGRLKIEVITISDGLEKAYEFSTNGPKHLDTIFVHGTKRFHFEISEINPQSVAGSPILLEDYNIEFNLETI